jgi:hypothetical protein
VGRDHHVDRAVREAGEDPFGLGIGLEPDSASTRMGNDAKRSLKVFWC